MKIDYELLPPTMPNFISIKRPPVKRQEGFMPTSGIPITELTEQQAIEYGELMKQTFINHWKKKIEQP